MILTIYIIGYILAYISTKYWRNTQNLNDWSDVIITLFLSLASYVLLIAMLIIIITQKIGKTYTKPPKWL